MPKSAGYVSAEFLQKAAERMKPLKERSYEWMDIQSGSHVLDVGCGPGMDTIAMAKLVRSHGRVFGLDIDEEMLEKADAYAQAEGVQDIVKHQIGDVMCMPFEDNTFDAIRAERLYQVLPDSYDRLKVFEEMLRVTRPGGKLVLADSDWATASVNFENTELERRLMTFFALKMRPNGFAGRQFCQLFTEKKLSEIRVEHFPMVMRNLQETPFGEWLKNEALASHIANEEEMQHWMTRLESFSETGLFYSSVNMVIVSGVKPEVIH